MLRQIWQWLKRLFQRLFGLGTRPADRYGQDIRPTSQDAPSLKPLDDSDLEFLFRQLLEGISHSWSQERILRWFEALEGRITEAEWVAWLRRFGERVLASSAPNQELGVRLIQLGEQTQSIPSVREIGEAAYNIGRQLLSRETSGAVWEYEGPDVNSTPAAPLTPPYPGGEVSQQEVAESVEITLDELLERLQQDPNFLQRVAQQLGIETTDPQVIIQELIAQFNATDQSTADEAVAWFNQGIQQDAAGDFLGAIASYDQVIEISSNFYEAWFNRGNSLSNVGRFEEALASYDKAIEIKPDLHEAWNNRANALFNLGRLDEGRASLEKAQEIQGS
jgi:tetratricopeptide (TPR) repeat protein